MATKQPDSKQLYDEYEHALFRMLVHKAAESEGEELLALRDTLNRLPDSGPPEESLQRFAQQLDTHLKQEQAGMRRRKLMRGLSRVAAVVLAIGVLFFTAMSSVKAFRVRVMNLWMEIRPEFTTFGLKEAGPDVGASDQVVDWTKAHVPTYIPEGFKITDVSIRETERTLTYFNGTDYLLYHQLDEFSFPAIDTENAEINETVDINGHRGTLVYKNRVSAVIWEMDGYLFTVHIWADPDTALKVARGVKFVD